MSIIRDILNRYHLRRAERGIGAGALELAGEHLVAIEEPGPLTSQAWRLKGRLLGRAGRPLAAIECLRSAAKAPGASFACTLELAYWLTRARDFDRAGSLLEAYLARRPGDRLAVTLLAHVFRAQGRFGSALDTLLRYRPRSVVGKYADTVPPPPKISWDPKKAWADCIEAADERLHPTLEDPAASARDPERRDDLICFFDELVARPGGKRALVTGVQLALASDASWLMGYLRECEAYLRLAPMADLPMFVARHGRPEDKSLLIAALAEGGALRAAAASALISLGHSEFEEVLRERRRQSPRARPAAPSAWTGMEAPLLS